MFDDLLHKKLFEAKYQSMGYEEQQIVNEWQKLEDEFMANCIDRYLEQFPEDVRTQMEAMALKRSKEGAEEFVTGFQEYLSKNPGRIDEVSLMRSEAAKIMVKYKYGTN